MADLTVTSTLKAHQERVWHVSWNPAGSELASCGADKTISLKLLSSNSDLLVDVSLIYVQIRIWWLEGDNWVCKTILSDGHQRTIRCVSWSPCGNLLASASFDGTICIWDKKHGEFQCSSTLEGHENEVKCASWSVCGKYLATCSRDKSVWVWDVLEDGEEYECASVLLHHTQDVKSVQWHPKEPLLASASYDNTIKIYGEEDDDWTCISTLEGHESTVWSIAFESSGKRLASCSADKTVKVWQREDSGNKNVWSCVCSICGYHEREIYHIDWSLSGLIGTGCGDDTIRLFKEISSDNAMKFELVAKESKLHEGDVNCVKWNPKDPTVLASCSDDNTIKIWKLSDV